MGVVGSAGDAACRNCELLAGASLRSEAEVRRMESLQGQLERAAGTASLRGGVGRAPVAGGPGPRTRIGQAAQWQRDSDPGIVLTCGKNKRAAAPADSRWGRTGIERNAGWPRTGRVQSPVSVLHAPSRFGRSLEAINSAGRPLPAGALWLRP